MNAERGIAVNRETIVLSDQDVAALWPVLMLSLSAGSSSRNAPFPEWTIPRSRLAPFQGTSLSASKSPFCIQFFANAMLPVHATRTTTTIDRDIQSHHLAPNLTGPHSIVRRS